jgi:hypothetical protein
MLIIYNKLLNIPTLKKLCKINKIKNYSGLNKKEIITILNYYKSACYIQRTLRKTLMTEDLCPITFDSLSYPFVSLKNDKVFRYYSLNGILNYYNSCKDYRDPFTKEEISSSKLKEINKLAKYYKKKQITSSTQNNNISLESRTELLTILCCLNDIVNNIMLTTNISSDFIYNYAIPQIMTYSYYLIIRCRQQAKNILEHFIGIIENHVDLNKYHIINYIVGIIISEEL